MQPLTTFYNQTQPSYEQQLRDNKLKLNYIHSKLDYLGKMETRFHEDSSRIIPDITPQRLRQLDIQGLEDIIKKIDRLQKASELLFSQINFENSRREAFEEDHNTLNALVNYVDPMIEALNESSADPFSFE